MNIPDGDYHDGRVERKKTVVEIFKLPASRAIKYTPSTDPIRTEGKGRKHYSAGELRRKAARKARRERERQAVDPQRNESSGRIS